MTSYNTQSGNPPGSVFEGYTCKQCEKEWISNKEIKGLCPICRGDMDKWYQPIKRIIVGDKVFLKGTKGRGNSWDEFITNPHFLTKTKEQIYGKVYALQSKEIWIHIYDKITNKLLDKSTWGFVDKDLLLEATK